MNTADQTSRRTPAEPRPNHRQQRILPDDLLPEPGIPAPTTRGPLRGRRWPCAGPSARTAVPVVSMEGVFVPGHNRFPASDFPRLAVSGKFGTVSMVWNDARFHPFGDILLQSFSKRPLRPVQAKPVTLDQPHNGGLSQPFEAHLLSR
jgi:hypothetical protein